LLKQLVDLLRKEEILTNLLDLFHMILEMWNVIIEKYIKNPITIPIYYTKYLAENENSVLQKYKELLGGVKN
jgi:hypothetical protein